MGSLLRASIAILATYSAGFIGSLFVSTNAGGWYDSLVKPAFMPPDWLFMPVWLVLYGLMSLSLIIMWSKDTDAKDWHGWVPLYFAHLVVNTAWTVFFFGFHTVFISLVAIFILVFAIIMLIAGATTVDTRAAYLLVPYLLWVLFATFLTASIWYLN